MTREEKLRLLAALNRSITALRVAIDELNDWLVENPSHPDENRVRAEIQRLEAELEQQQQYKEAIRNRADTMDFPGQDVLDRMKQRANEVADDLADQQAADALISAAGRTIQLAQDVRDEVG